jgi:hypothetical protein
VSPSILFNISIQQNDRIEFCYVMFCPGAADGDTLSRLSPVLEQLDILEIQQTAIRQLTTEQESAANASVTPASTVRPVTAEATKTPTPTPTPPSVVVSAEGGDSESEADRGVATDVTPEPPKPAEVPVPSVTDAKKAKVSSVTQQKVCL